jgi:protein tyrosine phosphatase (PTP) superfamily phosphohydrolase (DUF442 family)
MINELQLSPTLYTGGSPNLIDLVNLQAAGVQVVINLALVTSPNAIPDEAGEVARLGMEYIHIPVIWETPTRQNLADFFDAMERNQGKGVFVHCVKNMRVSAFIYLYRILRQGWAPDDAILNLIEIWEPEGTWEAFIEESLTHPI